jgi:hypothetical protein
MVTAVVALAFGVLLIGACGGSDGDGASEGTTTTSAPSSTPGSTGTDGSTGSTSSSTPTTPTASTPSRPTAFTTTARDAVNELKASWETGDRARAALVAPGEVVDALFPLPSDNFEVYGCDTGEFETSSCNYRNRSTGVYITVTCQRHPQGWQVATIEVVQD